MLGFRILSSSEAELWLALSMVTGQKVVFTSLPALSFDFHFSAFDISQPLVFAYSDERWERSDTYLTVLYIYSCGNNEHACNSLEFYRAKNLFLLFSTTQWTQGKFSVKCQAEKETTANEGRGLRTCASSLLLCLDVGLWKTQRPSMGLDSSGVQWNIWEEWGHTFSSASHSVSSVCWVMFSGEDMNWRPDKWLTKETVASILTWPTHELMVLTYSSRVTDIPLHTPD